jgi:hypothetical protein
MNIQAEKIEIMKMILDTDNPIILESVKNIFKISTTIDFWDTLPQEQKEDILKGLNDIENGNIVDYEDFIKQHR